jgi:UDP-N-acetylenolpyruvoylglucosamine reductase
MRHRKHPATPCSAGCFFKNVEDPRQPHGKLPAGKLLDEVGAKQMRVGGAAVFPEHANILINAGGATSKDIRELADILKEKVKKRFNIELQEEVICLGDF